MDKSSRVKNVFFNNLLLLGFDPDATEKEYRVTCNRNMFSLPNQKMFEVVTHFLFLKLKRKNKYVYPWPLLDREQHRQFQKLTFNYLSSIAQESNVKFPRITLSLLSTFSGERFYELYVAFSSHVVEQEIRANGNVELISRPKMSSLNSRNVAKTLKILTISSTEKSQCLQKLFCQHFEELSKCANDFSLLVKKLKSTWMANNSKLQERTAHFCSLYSRNSTTKGKSTFEDSMKKVLEYETKVKMLWTSLETFLLKEKELWRCMCSEVEDNNERCVLDGTHIRVSVPDVLVEEHNEELKAIEVNSIRSEENGKLCLLRYMKLFIIYLESTLKSYNKGELSNIHCEVGEILKLDDSLKDVKILSEKAMNILSDVQKHTENLQKNLYAEEFSDELEDFIKECSSWNFCSRSFNENINSFRASAISNFSYENLVSGLLFNESSTGSEYALDKTSCSEESFEESCISDVLSAEYNESTIINLEPIELKENTDSNETLNFLVETTCKENPDVMNEYFDKNMLSGATQDNREEKNVITAVPPVFDASFDFEINYSKPFKMRESWQLEDTLEAITMPEDSIDFAF